VSKRTPEATAARPVRHRRNRHATEEGIVAAALGLLADGTASGLGVNAVAEAAGVNKQLIYRYFGGMDGLIRVLAARVETWLGGSLRFQPGEPYAEAVARLLATYLQRLRANPELQGMLAWEMQQPGASTRLLEQERSRHLQAWVRELRTARIGQSADPDPAASNALLLGAIHHLVLRGRGVGRFAGIELDAEGWRRLQDALHRLACLAHGTGNPAATRSPDEHASTAVPEEIQTAVILFDLIDYSRLTDLQQYRTLQVLGDALREHLDRLACHRDLRADALILGMVPTGDGLFLLLRQEYAAFGLLFALSLRTLLLSIREQLPGPFAGVRLAVHIGPVRSLRDITGGANFVGSGLNDCSRYCSYRPTRQQLDAAACPDDNLLIASDTALTAFERQFNDAEGQAYREAIGLRIGEPFDFEAKHGRRLRAVLVEAEHFIDRSPPPLPGFVNAHVAREGDPSDSPAQR
jgi:AcrR family transcriptional regulator